MRNHARWGIALLVVTAWIAGLALIVGLFPASINRIAFAIVITILAGAFSYWYFILDYDRIKSIRTLYSNLKKVNWDWNRTWRIRIMEDRIPGDMVEQIVNLAHEIRDNRVAIDRDKKSLEVAVQLDGVQHDLESIAGDIATMTFARRQDVLDRGDKMTETILAYVLPGIDREHPLRKEVTSSKTA
jgi:hypothetical protein